MGKVKLEKFGGQLPAWDDTLLPEGQAASTQNCYLFGGSLIGWREPKLLRALNNSAATMVYRIPTITQSVASAVLAFISNPHAGDTVKVGEETYTFVSSVVNAYDVLLGGSATASATNLFDALTLSAGTAGTTFGLGTVANPALSTTAGDNVQTTHDFGSGAIPTLILRAPTFGAAYNTTAATESTSGARLKWLYDAVSLSHTTTTFLGGTNESFDNNITGAATWLEFTDPDTTVMRAPVVDDKFGRYYFASPSQPPTYNTYDRIVAGKPAYLLGVPAPGCAPGVSVSGGGDLTTLGYATSNITNTDTPGSNFLILTRIAPTGSMTLNEVSLMPETTSTTAKFTAVIYSDGNNAPFELLDQGPGVTGCIAGATVTDVFTNTVALTLNTPYWIGFMLSEAVAIQLADATSTNGVKHSATYSNGPPLLAPTMTTNQPTWRMWATLTTASLLEARSYTYTWITEFGEEGPPAPPTVLTGWANGTWKVDLFTPAPDEMGVTRNITTTRIYRTVPSTAGTANYFWVADVPVAQQTYVDTFLDDVIALNTPLPSAFWFPPPENLQAIMSMPNGMTVGFTGNEIWFAEAYRPHAWNPGYVLTTEFPIVGIGVTGQTVVAATEVSPYAATGVNPGSMSLNKANAVEPCISRGSIVSTNAAVFYSSPNGLIAVTQIGIASNTTEGWITREKWRKLTPSKNIRAILLATDYFAFGTVNGTDHDVAQQGFTVELRTDASSFTIWPQPGGHRLGFGGMSAPNGYDIYNVQVDPWTGIGLLIQNGNVYYYDFTDLTPTIQPYTWRSKKYQDLSKKNYEAMKVYFDIPPGSPALSATRNQAATLDSSWNTLGANQYAIMRVYADGVLVTTREIRSSGELLRIISGFKADFWQFEITGRVNITNVQVATSVKELAQI